MKTFADPAIVIILLTNIMMLGSSSLRTCVTLVALQGVVLGLLPLMIGHDVGGVALLACITIAVKGVGFPWLLSRALRETDVHREAGPVVGYTTSVLAGVCALGLAQWISSHLPLAHTSGSPLVMLLALFMIQCGFFLIISRNKALSQVLGYLVLENGIYAFGVGLALKEHMLVEMCVLLDVFVAVFVMGIIIFHISREFDHMDIDQLSKLKDWNE